jgi:hypothetical protein
VTLVDRVGIRIYLAVGPGGGPPSSFTLGALSTTTAPNGAKVASVVAHNTGGRAVDLTGQLSLTSKSDGLRAGPFAAAPTIIAAGQSFQVPVPLPAKLPGGPWQAVIHLQSGLLAHSEHATITFTTAATARGFPATSITTAALILLVLGVAVLLTRYIRRRRRRTPAGELA